MQKVADSNDVVGLSVLGVCNGQIIDSFYYGMSDIARKVSVTEKTRYRVASVSKHVATIGLMQLYQQGKFKLDDDVSTALGFKLRHPSYPDLPITYRMILSH
jgi:CubicO group peptidase (beta-lactamase class C family)